MPFNIRCWIPTPWLIATNDKIETKGNSLIFDIRGKLGKKLTNLIVNLRWLKLAAKLTNLILMLRPAPKRLKAITA